ncbi:hypothetical protein ACIOD2_01275 [Amycolatopsis sp. NPDC088138]|uniref:hypothetical protein n=1 Tax=Amycolatopsis sp. NPDC088138 TaxID=3363938 RepID=UPI0037F22549
MTAGEVRSSPPLPGDPRFPAQPTLEEVGRARLWLFRHGVRTTLPTRLIALRAGSRSTTPSLVLVSLAAFVGAWATASIDDPPFAHAAGALVLAVAFAVWTLVRRQAARYRDQLAAQFVEPGGRPSPSTAAGLVGAWSFVSFGITFIGGAALYGTLVVISPPMRSAAAVSLVVLGVGLVPAGLALLDAFTAPVIAEDEASAAVDRFLRSQDVRRFVLPAAFAWLAGINAPVAWQPLQLGYLALAIGTQLAGWLHGNRRRLPPGWYGLP